MKRIVAINGSYRKNGVIDTLVTTIIQDLKNKGAEIIRHDLIDENIEFCTNCRACTQLDGKEAGKCIHNDSFSSILSDILSSDALILAAPTNFFTVNALTKKFIERLVCLAYWPFGQGGPKYRITHQNKKALVVSSMAMPAFLGRIFTSSVKILKIAAKTAGFKVCGSLLLGTSVLNGKPNISDSDKLKAIRLGQKLLS